jgi:hypothetical protein
MILLKLALNTMCTPDIAEILLKLAVSTMCTPDIAEILLKLALNTMCTPDIAEILLQHWYIGANIDISSWTVLPNLKRKWI